MAAPGINFELTEESRQHAVKYVEESGFYKNRLADFLSISRPTLDKLLEENPDFFTALKRADAIFCKSLIDGVRKRNPFLILRTKYNEEFHETLKFGFDPEIEIQKIKQMIDASSTNELPPLLDTED
mgnify:CR=1 FL=1